MRFFPRALRITSQTTRGLPLVGIRCLTSTTITRFNAARCGVQQQQQPPPSSLEHHGQAKPMVIDRELPDPFKDKKKNIIGFIVFATAVSAALAIIYNYEKVENSIIYDTIYQLRKSERTRELLGDDIEFAGLIPWIYGTLHPVKGIVDIKFYIKGTKDVIGTVRLVADRENHLEEFLIHEWTLTVGDQKVDLLAESDQKTIPPTR